MTRLAGSSKLLRAMNESATLALLLDRGTLTRAELRELTGLSKPTTSDVLRTLTDAGLAQVIGHTSGGPGPNAEIYAINPSAAHVAAISIRDLSVNNHPALAAAVCDLSGTVLARAEYDINTDDPLQAVQTALGKLCQAAGLEVGSINHVQLGVPGSYDQVTDTIRHIDVSGWGRPGLVGELASRLSERDEDRPNGSIHVTVSAENDVNLAAIAERHRGVIAASAASGTGSNGGGFALVWFGAGLGCAIDLGDTLLRGASGGAGEIGYVPSRSHGDLQDLVGGPAVLALAGRHGFDADTPEAAIKNAVTLATPAAQAFLTELAHRISLAITAVAAILDPPLVVLAGEVAQAGGETLRDLVADALQSESPLSTPVAVTALTDDAVLLGALDAGLHTVRESLIDSLRAALTAA